MKFCTSQNPPSFPFDYQPYINIIADFYSAMEHHDVPNLVVISTEDIAGTGDGQRITQQNIKRYMYMYDV